MLPAASVTAEALRRRPRRARDRRIGRRRLSASAGIGVTAPRRVVQGNDAKIEVAVRNGTRCTLSFRYKNRAYQKASAPRSRAAARLRGSGRCRRARSPAPPARISCGAAGSATRTIVVVGSVIPASLTVLKQGFSVKPRRFAGADASWGVIVKNTSPQSDAERHGARELRDAGQQADRLGDRPHRPHPREHGTRSAATSASPGVPPVSRLEIVAQIGESGRAARTFGARERPHPPRPLRGGLGGLGRGRDPERQRREDDGARACSTVVLDASGNVGGQTGNAMASLPPGSRQFFKISGMRGVTFSNAASAIVSVNPSYRGERLIRSPHVGPRVTSPVRGSRQQPVGATLAPQCSSRSHALPAGAGRSSPSRSRRASWPRALRPTSEFRPAKWPSPTVLIGYSSERALADALRGRGATVVGRAPRLRTVAVRPRATLRHSQRTSRPERHRLRPGAGRAPSVRRAWARARGGSRRRVSVAVHADRRRPRT